MKTETKPKVKLLGRDGNAFAILGAATEACKKAGWSQSQVDEFIKDAMSADYDYLLQTVMKHCEVS